ncbi:MAG: TraR/DksA family transcriptional regulator [Verrucomicrobiales bacterium]|nr:TraR/DksA family transcriptional regulator [Verrucomicrobiales bacterium]
MDSPIDFNAHRQRLLDEKEEVARRLLAHSGVSDASVESEPCNWLDMAHERNEIRIEERIAAIEDRHLHAIDEALHRLISEAYGNCETCNEPIDRARLNAAPDATLCAHCQNNRESVGHLHVFTA